MYDIKFAYWIIEKGGRSDRSDVVTGKVAMVMCVVLSGYHSDISVLKHIIMCWNIFLYTYISEQIPRKMIIFELEGHCMLGVILAWL